MKVFITILFFGISFFSHAQRDLEKMKSPISPSEIKIKTISKTIKAGDKCEIRNDHQDGYYRTDWHLSQDRQREYSTKELYDQLVSYSKEYENSPTLAIRNFKCNITYNTEYKTSNYSSMEMKYTYKYYHCSCDVVAKDLNVSAMEQALSSIREGSRFAIDNVIVTEGLDREATKDKIVDMLLDRGYKVVAKEYLEKLYVEQKNQQSGIYNDRTTVKENNFTAVGYFINIKASKKSVRIQIVNVSTGEYDGYSVVYMPDQNNYMISDENLSQVSQKALRNVVEGSRIAIDNVSAIGDNDKEYYKDKCIDILVKKGYKVVAKEYLEKLYEEQKQQQSEIYNSSTTVQDNNFSAVGYFVNIKITENSLRVQVINVSTGEYEGNATINF